MYATVLWLTVGIRNITACIMDKVESQTLSPPWPPTPSPCTELPTDIGKTEGLLYEDGGPLPAIMGN